MKMPTRPCQIASSAHLLLNVFPEQIVADILSSKVSTRILAIVCSPWKTWTSTIVSVRKRKCLLSRIVLCSRRVVLILVTIRCGTTPSISWKSIRFLTHTFIPTISCCSLSKKLGKTVLSSKVSVLSWRNSFFSLRLPMILCLRLRGWASMRTVLSSSTSRRRTTPSLIGFVIRSFTITTRFLLWWLTTPQIRSEYSLKDLTRWMCSRKWLTRRFRSAKRTNTRNIARNTSRNIRRRSGKSSVRKTRTKRRRTRRKIPSFLNPLSSPRSPISPMTQNPRKRRRKRRNQMRILRFRLCQRSSLKSRA